MLPCLGMNQGAGNAEPVLTLQEIDEELLRFEGNTTSLIFGSAQEQGIRTIIREHREILTPLVQYKRDKQSNDCARLAKSAEERAVIDAIARRMEKQFLRMYSGSCKAKILELLNSVAAAVPALHLKILLKSCISLKVMQIA